MEEASSWTTLPLKKRVQPRHQADQCSCRADHACHHHYRRHRRTPASSLRSHNAEEAWEVSPSGHGTRGEFRGPSPLQEAVGARPCGNGEGDRAKGADQHDRGSENHNGYSTTQIQGRPLNQRVGTMACAVRQIGVLEKSLDRDRAGTSASAISTDPQPPQKITNRIDPSGLLRLRRSCRSA